jgi:UDP-glucose 4-epimerase
MRAKRWRREATNPSPTTTSPTAIAGRSSGGRLEEADIADETRLRAVLSGYQPLAVMHFAAFAYVGESVEQPLLYYQNNVGGSIALLRAIGATASSTHR